MYKNVNYRAVCTMKRLKMANIPIDGAVDKESRLSNCYNLICNSKGLYLQASHRAWHTVHGQTWNEIQDIVGQKKKKNQLSGRDVPT